MKRMGKTLVAVVFMSLMMFSVASAKTTINWWGWFPTQEDFSIIKKGFEAENPDITLEASRFMYDDYVNKLKQEFSSGAGPDVMSIQEGSFFNQFKPYLANLTGKVDGFSKDVQPSVLAAAQKAGGGKLYYVPLGMGGTMFVYYNATLFKKAGVKVPTTAKEFEDAVAKLKKAYPDKVIVATGLKDGWWAADTFMTFANMVSPGITIKADKGDVKWNSPEFVKAMTMFQSLVKKGIIPKESVGLAEYEDAIGLFADEKALMHLNGSWNVGQMSNKTTERNKGRTIEKDEIGAFILPNFAGGKPVALGGMDVGIGVNKSLAKDKDKMDAALKLVQYMTVGKGQDYFCGKPGAGLIPVKKGLGLNMSVYDNATNKVGADNIALGFGKYFVGPREVSSSAVKNQFAVVIQNLVNGADVKKELDSLQNLFEREE